MKNAEELKKIVRENYGAVASRGKTDNQDSCCGTTCCSDDVANIMTDDYSELKGYNPEADLGLGCGLPTQFAGIKKGDTVIDLGSGAGNDCFVARAEAGETGKIIGVDMTPEMIQRARINVEKLGYTNVEFRQGDIEELPVSSDSADVVISNCVLNLVPDKRKVFAEIFRVLKPGGHFSISDIVLTGDLPSEVLHVAELYAGCISGATHKEEYLQIIREVGFEDVAVLKQKNINIPGDLLANYISTDEIEKIQSNQGLIQSITVFAKKKNDVCCDKTICCN